jgi:hypothetical protein
MWPLWYKNISYLPLTLYHHCITLSTQILYNTRHTTIRRFFSCLSILISHCPSKPSQPQHDTEVCLCVRAFNTFMLFATSIRYLHCIEIYPSKISHVRCIFPLQMLQSKTFKYFTPSWILIPRIGYMRVLHQTFLINYPQITGGCAAVTMSNMTSNFNLITTNHTFLPYWNSKGMKTQPSCTYLGYTNV